MTTSMRPRIGIIHLGPVVLLLVSLVVLAQQASSPQKPEDVPNATNMSDSVDRSVTSTFKSRADLVLVPVVVREKGRHIAGLTKDAFRLEENGKEQDISSFEEVQAPPDGVPPSPVIGRGYSNLPFDNTQQLRLTIIVLDLLNTTPLQRKDGKDQIVKFLSNGLARNQPVSLLCLTGKGVQLVQPFSTDAGVLTEALKKYPLGAETIMGLRNASEGTLRQLQEIAQAYGGVPGRKTMILAAGNVPELVPEHGVFDSSVLASDIRDMWKSLMDANISVYPIQLLNWSNDPVFRGRGVHSSEVSLREFADATGGNRCIETNQMLRCMAEAVEDSRSYYMLGFSVRPDDRKPGWRDLKVKVSIDHADIRARNGFYYGNPESPSPKSVRDTEVNALASALAYGAVPMFVRVLPPTPAPSADSAPNHGKKTTVEFLVTIPLNSIRIDRSSATPVDLEIGAIALTRDMREAGEFLHPLRGNPKPEVLQQFARDGIKLREKLELPPGTYDVRFMAHDLSSNQIGTVVFPLEVK